MIGIVRTIETISVNHVPESHPTRRKEERREANVSATVIFVQA